MISLAGMTVLELAGYISTHLREKGINVVLSGGSCVSIYSQGKYVSMDLDFVNAGFAKREKIREAMEEIDFQEENRYFKHPDTDYLVEFPPGPLGVGEEPVNQIDELEVSTGMIRIISPTDCVKDRLAGYYHWDDLQCLEQASLVAEVNEIDLEEIERWSEVEGKLDEFKRIMGRFTKKDMIG